jgi:hypothetical protein
MSSAIGDALDSAAASSNVVARSASGSTAGCASPRVFCAGTAAAAGGVDLAAPVAAACVAGVFAVDSTVGSAAFPDFLAGVFVRGSGSPPVAVATGGLVVAFFADADLVERVVVGAFAVAFLVGAVFFTGLLAVLAFFAPVVIAFEDFGALWDFVAPADFAAADFAGLLVFAPLAVFVAVFFAGAAFALVPFALVPFALVPFAVVALVGVALVAPGLAALALAALALVALALAGLLFAAVLLTSPSPTRYVPRETTPWNLRGTADASRMEYRCRADARMASLPARHVLFGLVGRLAASTTLTAHETTKADGWRCSRHTNDHGRSAAWEHCIVTRSLCRSTASGTPSQR